METFEELLNDINKTNKTKKVSFSNNISVKEILNDENNDLEDYEQMILMSLCQFNIIANSTFSWWSAYFNTNAYKIICYPKIWFGKKIKHNTNDLFFDDWHKI